MLNPNNRNRNFLNNIGMQLGNIKMKILVSDYCLMPSEQFFKLYHGENKLHLDDDDDDVNFVLDQHA